MGVLKSLASQIKAIFCFSYSNIKVPSGSDPVNFPLSSFLLISLIPKNSSSLISVLQLKGDYFHSEIIELIILLT